ncbi:helix-turn-helix domain-containing protein [Flagellimonas nanhaiensis]|uniref:Helix-turn-helix domain-containing protein n=1 Tax=Flagellimonas nanhaiensis TaxID=2292706 RepID=A0A371JUA9_9FLAO|nr:helix-turn-helix domain-containing protein [Allomuricauda nanhaiensis]RDY61401.1 helix-turn-helix domain-containing protein [Allomuricauda nanhaiensis]
MRTASLNRELELFLAGVGATQSLWMALYSIFERKRDFRNLLLFIFFISITVRLTKSILWVYLDQSPLWFINIGFAAHALSGPALFLYAWHFLFEKRWSNWNLFHFLPALILLVGFKSFSLDEFWYAGGYTSLLTHQLVYSLLSLGILMIYSFNGNHKVLSRTAFMWIIALIVGTAVLQFLYFSNYMLGLTPYLLGPIIYLPFIYFLAFLLFKNPTIIKPNKGTKSQNIRLTEGELSEIANQLEVLMVSKKMYLDPNCTLGKVAHELRLPLYLVSHTVNNQIGKSFPDFLNGYRVEEIKKRLVHPDFTNNTIASIAYDCGFNTLSSFNIAFKKTTGTTPTRFQKKNKTV